MSSIGIRESIMGHIISTIKKIPCMEGIDLGKLIKIIPSRRNGYNFQFMFVFKLFTELIKRKRKNFKKPHELIDFLLPLLNTDKRFKFEITGRIYLVLYLKNSTMSELINLQFQSGIRPINHIKQNVIIDYSSPNIAKELHVGHLRSTIIGDALANIFEFNNHKVTRINHVGDWGTQFGMLIAHIKEQYTIDELGELSIRELGELYKESKKRFDEDSVFNETAHNEVSNLQKGDKTNVAIWKQLYRISEKAFNEIYKRLSINQNLTIMGESHYNESIPIIIDELENKGLVEEHDGMLCVKCDTTGNKVPLIIRKSDGSYGYDSTDLAAIKYRLDDLGADRIIYVVDIGQQEHFKKIFATAEKARWLTNQRVDHCKFGLVLGNDGKKFKSREDGTVKLVDLLDEACKKSYERLKEHIDGEIDKKTKISEELQSNLANDEIIHDKTDEFFDRIVKINDEIDELKKRDDDEIRKTSDIIAYSGLKYFDMSRDIAKNYKFDYEEMLNQNGDTATYIQYAYARMKSLMRKGGKKTCKLMVDGGITICTEEERNLTMELLDLPYVISDICKSLKIQILCRSMRKICVSFSVFYNTCRIIGDKHESSRLLLTYTTMQALEQIMKLLGMEQVERI